MTDNDPTDDPFDVDLSEAESRSEARQLFARQVREQTDADIGPDDIEEDDDELRLTARGERRIAAAQIDEEIPDIEITGEDLEATDEGGFRPSEDVQQALQEQQRSEFAQQLDEQYQEIDIGRDDLRTRDDGTIELGPETQQELQRRQAAQEFDEELSDRDIRRDDVIVDDDGEEVRLVDDVAEDLRRERAAQQIDEEIEGQDITSDDVILDEDEVRLRDAALREQVSDDILAEAPDAYFGEEDIVIEDTEDGREVRLDDISQLEFERDVAVASAARQTDPEFVSDVIDEAQEEGQIGRSEVREFEQEITRAHTEDRAFDFGNVPGELTGIVAEEVQQRDFLGVDTDVFLETFREIEDDLSDEQVTEFQRELSRAADEDRAIDPDFLPEPVVDELTDDEFGQEVADATVEETLAGRVARDAGDLVDADDVMIDRTDDGIEAGIPDQLREDIAIDEFVSAEPDIGRGDIAGVDAIDDGFEFDFTDEFRRERAIDSIADDPSVERDDIAGIEFGQTISEEGLSEAVDDWRAGDLTTDEIRDVRDAFRHDQAVDDDLAEYAGEEVVVPEFTDEFRRERAAEELDEEIEELDIDAGDIVFEDDAFALGDETIDELEAIRLDDAREEAAEQFDERFPDVSVREDDIEIDPEAGDIELADDVVDDIEAVRERRAERLRQREIEFIRDRQEYRQRQRQEAAAEEIDDQIPFEDIGTDQIEYVADGEVQLTGNVEREIAARELDQQIGMRDIEADDVVLGDDGVQLDDEVQADLADMQRTFDAVGRAGAAPDAVQRQFDAIEAGDAFARVGADVTGEAERMQERPRVTDTLEETISQNIQDEIDADLQRGRDFEVREQNVEPADTLESVDNTLDFVDLSQHAPESIQETEEATILEPELTDDGERRLLEQELEEEGYDPEAAKFERDEETGELTALVPRRTPESEFIRGVAEDTPLESAIEAGDKFERRTPDQRDVLNPVGSPVRESLGIDAETEEEFIGQRTPAISSPDVDLSGDGVDPELQEMLESPTVGRETMAEGAMPDARGVDAYRDVDAEDVGRGLVGAGALGVASPDPVTDVGGGAAIVGGSLLVGGAVVLDTAVRRDDILERDPEIAVPEQAPGEVDQQEIDVPDVFDGSEFREIETPDEPAGRADRSELQTPDRRPEVTESSEISVPETTDETDPTVIQTQQVAEGVLRDVVESEEVDNVDVTDRVERDRTATITEGDLLEPEDVRISEQERRTQIREELERRQEFAREDSDFSSTEVESVRTERSDVTEAEVSDETQPFEQPTDADTLTGITRPSVPEPTPVIDFEEQSVFEREFQQPTIAEEETEAFEQTPELFDRQFTEPELTETATQRFGGREQQVQPTDPFSPEFGQQLPELFDQTDPVSERQTTATELELRGDRIEPLERISVRERPVERGAGAARTDVATDQQVATMEMLDVAQQPMLGSDVAGFEAPAETEPLQQEFERQTTAERALGFGSAPQAVAASRLFFDEEDDDDRELFDEDILAAEDRRVRDLPSPEEDFVGEGI